MWIVFALISAGLVAVSSVLEKETLAKEHSSQFAALLAILCALLTAPYLFKLNWQAVEPIEILSIAIVGLLAGVAFLLVTKAVRHTEISSSLPLLALRPAVIAALSFIALGEEMTRLQVLGIILLIIGTYVLESRQSDTLLGPIKKLVDSKYVHYVLLAILLYSVTATLDRWLLAATRRDLDPVGYLSLVHIAVALTFIPVIGKSGSSWVSLWGGFKKYWHLIGAVALLTVSYRLADIFAVKTAYVGLVSAVRSVSILLTVILGGELFHEHNLGRKIIATMIMLAGAFLVAF